MQLISNIDNCHRIILTFAELDGCRSTSTPVYNMYNELFARQENGYYMYKLYTGKSFEDLKKAINTYRDDHCLGPQNCRVELASDGRIKFSFSDLSIDK